MDITDVQHGNLLRGSTVDTTANREKKRQARLLKLAVALGFPLVWFWTRELMGNPVRPGLPPMFADNPELTILAILLILMCSMAFLPYLGAGKSPHTLLRPSDSKIRLALAQIRQSMEAPR